MSEEPIDLQRRASFAKTMLEDVLAASKHEDEKIGRLLTSMAFLVLAGTTLFTGFLYVNFELVYKVDLVGMLFIGFIVLMMLSTFFMQEAMTPRLRLPFGANKASSSTGDVGIPRSLSFFKDIAATERSEWLAYFKTVTDADLFKKEYEDSVSETYLVATKVARKVKGIKRGKWFLSAAILLLAIMTTVAIIAHFS